MVRVLVLIQDLLDKRTPFDSDILDPDSVPYLKIAIASGVDYILKSQLIIDGQREVWCAQHNPENYSSESGRAYELRSKSGLESVGVAWFLMQYPNQTAEIRSSVLAAANWFRENQVENWAFSQDMGSFFPQKGKVMWYRFYDLNDNRPIFADRDGIKKYNLANVGLERRQGYSWAGVYAKQFLEAVALYSTNP